MNGQPGSKMLFLAGTVFPGIHPSIEELSDCPVKNQIGQIRPAL